MKVNFNDISFLLQVVVVTHAYGDRSGVRYLTNFLKVFKHSSASLLLCRAHVRYQIFNPCKFHIYCFLFWSQVHYLVGILFSFFFNLFFLLLFQVYYLPFGPFHNQCALPTLYTTLPLMRCILLRERITIVHGHSVSS